jgi:hypothetical protein
MRDPRLDLWLQKSPRFLARRKCQGPTVRAVRIVRAPAEIQSGNGFAAQSVRTVAVTARRCRSTRQRHWRISLRPTELVPVV